MSNSSLVNYTKISPHKNSPRNHKIDTITIHCVVGQCSVESLGNVFCGSRDVSANYGIGYDGKIGMYVEEKDRSWCTSSYSNDHRAITIEVASDTTAPYKVNDKAYAALINLVADICKRNGIKKLMWKNDKSLIGQVDKQNMTVHRWFASTACPGDYLMSRMGDIANKVNEKLGVNKSDITLYKKDGKWFYMPDGKTVDKTHIGLAKNEYGWWYVKNGTIDFTYTGLAKNDYGIWYVTKGKIDFTFNGTAKYENETCTVKDGKAVSVLSKGSQSEDVRILQKKLNAKGYKLTVDGIFGDKTLEAVKDFQKKNNLEVDGIVGKNTWAKLG